MIDSPSSIADRPPADRRRFGALTLALSVAAALAVGAAAMYLATRSSATPASTTAAHADGEADHEALPPGIVEIPAAAQENAGVTVTPVSPTTVPVTVEATGVVAADESRLTHVRPLARGVVEKVLVTLGSRVTAGQPLIVLDNIELGELIGTYLSARAAVRQSLTDLEVRQRALERARALITLEGISQQVLDQRDAEWKNADAAVASQRANLARVEEQIHRFGLTDADLEKLKPEDASAGHRVASHSTLRAPFAGVVTKYDVAVGESVGPDSELLTVADLSTVWVLADVYEKDLARLRQADDVRITLEAYPDRTFTGRLTYISDMIDPKTRAAKVRVVVLNQDQALKLEMFARCAVPTKEQREGLAVSVDAVQQIDNQPVVFLKRSDTRFERRNVRLGASTDTLVEILDGLSAGDTIVTAGSFYLKTALLRERIGDEH